MRNLILFWAITMQKQKTQTPKQEIIIILYCQIDLAVSKEMEHAMETENSTAFKMSTLKSHNQLVIKLNDE